MRSTIIADLSSDGIHSSEIKHKMALSMLWAESGSSWWSRCPPWVRAFGAFATGSGASWSSDSAALSAHLPPIARLVLPAAEALLAKPVSISATAVKQRAD